MQHWTERHQGMGLELHVHRFRADRSQATPSSSVMLLHGFMDAGGSWDLVAEGLCRRGHDVYAPDFRGFGLSDHVSGGGYYHFPNYLADIAALLRHLAPPNLTLVGHSMGGTVACMVAATRPTAITKLVLLEGVGPPAMAPELTVTRSRRWLDELARPRRNKPLASVDDAAERLGLHHPRLDRDLLRTRAAHLVVERDGVLHWAFDPLHRSTSPSAFNVETFTALLAEIRCPVLFIGGGEHGWHPADEQERLTALPQPAKQLVLERAGHMMHWTEPGAVATAIADFVTSA